MCLDTTEISLVIVTFCYVFGITERKSRVCPEVEHVSVYCLNSNNTGLNSDNFMTVDVLRYTSQLDLISNFSFIVIGFRILSLIIASKSRYVLYFLPL